MSGPVPGRLERRQWLAMRLAFVTEAYGVDGEETLLRLLEQEDAIDRAGGEGEIILWFEHDLFCLVNLLYLLIRLQHHPSRLSLVWFGAVAEGRVRPLGALSIDEITALFEARTAVADSQHHSAQRAWSRYSGVDALAINELLADDRAFPFLGEGMSLHAARFPSLRNGLGRIEQEALDLIAGGQRDFRNLFPAFSGRNSGYGMGDSDLAWTLTRLAQQAVPLLRSSERPLAERSYELTEAGHSVRTGTADNIALNGIDLWLGGIHLQTAHPMIRWNGAALIKE